MTRSKARLLVQFEFDLDVPEKFAALDAAALQKQLTLALGDTVFTGMRTVSSKQLNKVGIQLLAHRHRVEASMLDAPSIDPALLARIAPHLTDQEVQHVSVHAAAKAPTGTDALRAYLRRQALAVANDYRLIPCTVQAATSGGAVVMLGAKLNLTNGGVLVDEAHRKVRLKSDQSTVSVSLGDPQIILPARLSGHTLSGPVLAVDVAHMAPHRDALQSAWAATQCVSG
jgi:hypothetical protein